jgi:integrase
LLAACKTSGVPPTSFHILRHTWASQRIMRGMPLMAVAQVLGHRDTRMVERHYGHLAPSWVRDAVMATALDFGPHGENVTPLRPTAS